MRISLRHRGTTMIAAGLGALTLAAGVPALASARPAASHPAASHQAASHINDCVPNCAEGHFHAYPVLITAWRAVPRPRHAGQRYFSRLTEIYTGKRPAYYRGPGKKYYPQTVTWHLTGTIGGPRQ